MANNGQYISTPPSRPTTFIKKCIGPVLNLRPLASDTIVELDAQTSHPKVRSDEEGHAILQQE
jgi:hypothetical protein